MAEQNNMPTRKMGAVGIAGALTTVIITISRDMFNYEMTADLAAAVTAIITFAAGYFTANSTAQDRPDA
jgi:hypothetical protein